MSSEKNSSRPATRPGAARKQGGTAQKKTSGAASFFKALRSVKFAIVIVALIAVGAAIGGLIPQGGEPAAYTAAYPKTAKLILALGLDHFFSSPFFVVLVALFIINLGACTLHRIRAQAKLETRSRRFGPDILHLGILILLIGAIMSAALRTTDSVRLSRGDEAILPNGQKIRLVDVSAERYPNGAPKLYMSKVEVFPAVSAAASAKAAAPDTAVPRSASISVNHPLKLGGYSIYQADYGYAASVILDSAAGSAAPHASESAAAGTTAAQDSGEAPGTIRLYGGETREFDDGSSIFFMTVDGIGPDAQGIFMLNNDAGKSVARAAVGDTVGSYSVRAYEQDEISGLKVVSDPGYPLVLAGFILMAIGLCLTYFQKLRDMK